MTAQGRGPQADKEKREGRSREPASVLLVAAARAGSAGLRTFVQDSSNLELIATVADHAAAVAAARERRPDHILFATNGLTGDGISLLRALRTESPDSGLVVCTDEFRQEVLAEAIQVPVDGIVAWRDLSAEATYEALDVTRCGLRVMSRGVHEALLSSPRRGEGLPRFTRTEREVLRCLEAGLFRSGDIAKALHVNSRTVQRAIESLGMKLGVEGLYKIGKRVQELGIRID